MTHLWLVDLQRSAPALAALEAAAPRLTAHDRRRAAALKESRARAERLTLTRALRALIERLAGPGAARETFVTDPGGRPRLAGGSPAFSLSHVDGYALIGLASAGDIGVDLERDRAIRLSARRREELLAAATGLAGRRLPGATPDARFLQAWCRLEAFAKARGAGIGRTLSDLGLRSGLPRTPAEVEATARRLAGDANLTVRDLAIPELPHAPALYAATAMSPCTARPRALWLPTDRPALARLLAPRRRTG